MRRKNRSGVGPFFKWFGSKWQSAKHYPAPVGEIIEPFAGGAGYSCLHYEHEVTLYESHPALQELWAWLVQEATSAAIKEIPLDTQEGTDIRDLEMSHGQSLLLKHWQRTNTYGPSWTISPWGNKPGQWTANTRARLAEQIDAIRHWKIEGTYNFAPPRDGRTRTWFLDPPYQLQKFKYGCGEFNHNTLALFVNRGLPARDLIICCEARSKEGDAPNYLPFVDSHRSVTSRRKPDQSHHSRELIYIRHPLNQKLCR